MLIVSGENVLSFYRYTAGRELIVYALSPSFWHRSFLHLYRLFDSPSSKKILAHRWPSYAMSGFDSHPSGRICNVALLRPGVNSPCRIDFEACPQCLSIGTQNYESLVCENKHRGDVKGLL